MASTYDKIATSTLSSSGTITFSSIPATYTDLVLVTRLAGTAQADYDVLLNSDSGSNYSWTNMYTTGSASGSIRTPNWTLMRLDYYGYIGTTIGMVNIAHFFNYANTNTYKTVVAQMGNANNGLGLNVDLWRNTAAINSIAIQYTMASGSSATLYGIKAA
jgi:hypothetical protein